jgi:ribosomal protein L11 methyltransferase
MEWLEVSVTAENEAAEAVAEVLSRYAYRGVIIEAGPEGWNVGPVVVRAYLPADEQLRANKRRVEEALGHLNQISPVSPPLFRSVAEEDWAEAWKQRLTILHVGQHIVIRPSWLDHTPVSEDVVIRLDPGMAFGTGLHPTTQMCLVALEEMVQA